MHLSLFTGVCTAVGLCERYRPHMHLPLFTGVCTAVGLCERSCAHNEVSKNGDETLRSTAQ